MHFSGIVREGKRRGAALGYPTANIAPETLEADGIYAALVTVEDKEYFAAAFADPVRGVLEAYLLDFFGSLYGKEITIELKKKMRDTEKFHSDEELKTAISEDVNAVRQYFQLTQ